MDTSWTVTPKPANNNKTFIDGLAELGINKCLIQNKRILAELLEKEQAYHDKDSEAGSGGNRLTFHNRSLEIIRLPRPIDHRL